MNNNGNNSYKPTPIGGKQRTATRFYGSSVQRKATKPYHSSISGFHRGVKLMFCGQLLKLGDLFDMMEES